MAEPDDETTSLATRDADALDAYERTYMAGDGTVLYRGKRPAPKWMQLLLGGTALTGLALLFSAAWATGLAMIPIGIVIWALFSVLRFTVSERAVKVQYGLFGPTIPIAAIERAEAVDYDWKRFGGWGIRGSGKGLRMYNMPGDHGRALKIVWRDDQGDRRETYVGTPTPEPAVTAIAKAIRGLRAARAPVGELPEGEPEPRDPE